MSSPALEDPADKGALESDAAAEASSPAEFEEILRGLKEKGPVLEAFAAEYGKMLSTFTRTLQSEEKYLVRCKTLDEEVLNIKQQLEVGAKEDEDSAFYASALKEEIDRSLEQIESLAKREAEKRLRIGAIKNEISELQRVIEAGPGWTQDQSAMMTEFNRKLDDVSSQVDEKQTRCLAIRQDVTQLAAQVEHQEKAKLEVELQIKAATNEAADKISQSEKEVRRRDKLEKELKHLKTQVDQQQTTLTSKVERTREVEVRLKQLELKSKENRLSLEQFQRKSAALLVKVNKINDDILEQRHKITQLRNANVLTEMEIERQTQDVRAVQKETQKILKLSELTVEKTDQLEEEKKKYEEEKTQLEREIEKIISVDIEAQKTEGEEIGKSIAAAHKERELLNKKIVDSGDRTQHLFDLFKTYENTLKNLSSEIASYRSTVQGQRESVSQVVAEKEKYEREGQVAIQQYYTALEEVKMQENQISLLMKRTVEADKRIQQQQNLYEQVRTERNLRSKHLIESQSEIAELKRKFKIFEHQVEQMKEEITAKDHQLLKEKGLHHKTQKEREILRSDLTRIKKQIQNSEQIIANQETEIHKLSLIIRDADAEQQRQVKEYEATISERDLIQQQLIKRNEELSKLYEKLRLQRSNLQKGEKAYQDRQREINMLKAQIQSLDRECAASDGTVSSVDDLKRQITRLQEDIMSERTKIRALSDELERPLNVHRWRALECSDPQTFELLKSVQNMQKRLIDLTTQCQEKDRVIQEKENLYLELKSVISRLPGDEVHEQLKKCSDVHKEKVAHLRTMTLELEVCKRKVTALQEEVAVYLQGIKEMNDLWLREAKKLGETGDRRVGQEVQRESDIVLDNLEDVVGKCSEERIAGLPRDAVS